MTTILGVLFALSIPVPPAACAVDRATGLSIPRMPRGACVSAQADRTLFAQRSDEGLLIAVVSGEPAGTPDLEDRGARLVFCPAALLDFASAKPSSTCVSGERLEPGADAFTGAGIVQADVGLDGSAGAARVIGSVTSPAGARFDLTGSLASLGRENYSRIELGYAGSHAARTPAESLSRIDRVMSLDDEQWRVVETLLALTPQDWETFEAVVESGGASSGVPGKRIDRDPIQVEGVADVVETILSRVNAIRTNVTSLSSRTPDRPDIRSLIAQIDLGRLREMLDEVRDTVQGLLDVARELRAGFDTFNAVAFRVRLGTVLTDLESASTLYQRMLCLDDPDVTIREVSMAPVRRLIDRTPPVVLYALSRILDTLDPTWDQRIAAVMDAVPVEATQLCNEGGERASRRRFDPINVACNTLRPQGVGGTLGVAKTGVAVALLRFRYVKNHTKEEISATGGVTAVGGATAGTTVKNPAHEAAEKMVDRLENLQDALDKVTDYRKDCLDRDHDIEGDLLECAKDGCSCTVPLSVLLQGAVVPSYTYVADLVDVRIDQAESASLDNVEQARDKHTLATDLDHDETPEGYGLLCEAYRFLQSTTLRTTGPPAVKPLVPKAKVPGGQVPLRSR